jgi:hypothetical protein
MWYLLSHSDYWTETGVQFIWHSIPQGMLRVKCLLNIPGDCYPLNLKAVRALCTGSLYSIHSTAVYRLLTGFFAQLELGRWPKVTCKSMDWPSRRTLTVTWSPDLY